MKCMILAAGIGSRLRPLTDRMPKALVPVCGKPLIAWQLEELMAAGFNDIVVNVHHFADQLEAYLQAHAPAGCHIALSDERAALLNTGGALRHAAPLLADSDTGSVLVHNVDILSNVNLLQLSACADSAGATLLVSHRKTNRYLLFDDSMRLVGWTNLESGEVRSPYDHLNVVACHRFAFSGIHMVGTELLQLMQSWPESFSIIDFYLAICRERSIVGHVQPSLRLLDVGKQDTLKEAEAFVHSLGLSAK